MKALLEIQCTNPEIVIKALEPDLEKTEKFDASIDDQEGRIILKVESETITGLLAGINSYMRLIKTSIDVNEVK